MTMYEVYAEHLGAVTHQSQHATLEDAEAEARRVADAGGCTFENPRLYYWARNEFGVGVYVPGESKPVRKE